MPEQSDTSSQPAPTVSPKPPKRGRGASIPPGMPPPPPGHGYRKDGSLFEFKPKTARPPMTADQRRRVIEMYEAGWQRRDIAYKLGLSIAQVMRIRTRANKALAYREYLKHAKKAATKSGAIAESPKAAIGRAVVDVLLQDERPVAAVKAPLNVPTLKQWVEENQLVLDGEPVTFVKHEYLVEPYTESYQFSVDEKATQMGLTSLYMLMSMHRSKFKGYRGILYYFPTRTDVLDFSKSRISPLLSDNPSTIGQWIKETNSNTVKRIWDTFIYFRGMNSNVSVKSTPADMIVFDELDEAPEDKLTMAMKRMSHSQFKDVAMLSNPTLPDYGINKQWQSTDQRYWMLKCPKCNQYTCLEDTFPDCIVELKGEAVRLCQSCRDGVLDPAVGQWVAKKPDIKDKVGHHYSQLFSAFVSPREILDEYLSTTHMKHFYNLVIGTPYVEAQNRLTVQQVLELCSNDGMSDWDVGPCSMGVDQGNKLHVVIGKRAENKKGRIIYMDVTTEWKDLDDLMKKFNVSRCVIDAQPNLHSARAFAGRFKGRVFMNYYREQQRGSYKWDEQSNIVMCNRTESLDASHEDVQNSRVIFPKECDIMKVFAAHLHNVGKDVEEDEESGSKRWVYKRLGEDHFRHAFNYECMARQYQMDLWFPELI